MAERGTPSCVLWSTQETINAEIPSVTAIIESLIAVPLYWLIAVYFETYLPLLTAAAAAPLVLLRSDQSTALGVRWFKAWAAKQTDDQGHGRRRKAKQIALHPVVVASSLLGCLAAGVTAFLFLKLRTGQDGPWFLLAYAA